MTRSGSAVVLSIGLLIVLFDVAAVARQGAGAGGGRVTASFDDSPVDRLPSAVRAFKTGEGGDGRWAVIADASAPSAPNVLAQFSTDPSSKRYLLAVVGTSRIGDGQASVRFKTVSGVEDQGAGLAFRIADERNYYVIRANTIEKNFRLYKFVDGVRTGIGAVDLSMASGEWHQISVSFEGARLRCFYDGREMLDVNDRSLSAPGGVGVWTKADSVTYFDDLVAESR